MKWLSDEEIKFKYLCDEFLRRRNLKLVGECKKCGKCCKGGIRVFNFNKSTLCAELVGIKEAECIHYDKETKTCKTYTDDRPILCRLFPYTPEVLYEGCGYHFEEEKK